MLVVKVSKTKTLNEQKMVLFTHPYVNAVKYFRFQARKLRFSHERKILYNFPFIFLEENIISLRFVIE